MRIDPEGKTMHGASVFVTFVVLNVFYLLTCIPVITVGMSTSALFEVTMRYSDEEEGSLLRGYLSALRRNAARGTMVFVCFVIPMLLLAFSGLFWVYRGGLIAVGAAILAFLGTLYLFAAVLYGMALVARYRNSLRQTLKNALLLPVVEPWRTFVLIIIPATAVSLTAVFPAFVFILVTVGFSVGVYASGFLMHKIFARH